MNSYNAGVPELRWTEEEAIRTARLEGGSTGIGRASDNGILLRDFSVSRHHARLDDRDDGWWVVDLGSTNGVKVNGRYVSESRLAEGDRLQVGNFTLHFLSAQERPEAPLGSATFLRPLEEFRQDFPIETLRPGKRSPGHAVSLRERVLEAFAQVARSLLEADDLEAVLDRVMGAVFRELSGERAFILLFTCEGRPELRVSRSRQGKPLPEPPVSQTILDLIIRDRVAVLTTDAQADGRFAEGASVRMHGIRSAMCAPLWHRETVNGVLFVDTPMAVGQFGPDHLDLLTALANVAAVAIDRARLSASVEEERRIRERLERYHSPAVVEAIVGRRPATTGPDRPETREVSVLFADIVGFTARCESMEPPEVARFLTRFFSLASDVVFEYGGTLDKFVGDSVMAFFGAPLPQDDHAERAVQAAITLRRRLRRFNFERRLAGGTPVEVRIAINTGPVVVGDIGSATRVDYTVLGNAVNVAARLQESVARPGDIVLGPATHRAVAGVVPTEALGEVQLRGLQGATEVFRVIPGPDTGEA